MASLAKITEHLASFLHPNDIPDYPGAHNGLQLENRSGEVNKVAAAVDATLPVIKEAADAGVDLLIVHHGMFWGGAKPITGAHFEKLKVAMDANLAIYSSHIPLDVHPDLGNNALLCKALGILDPTPFMPWKGIMIGLKSESQLTRRELITRLENVVGGPVNVCRGGEKAAGTVGVITGGAGSMVEDAVAEGIDTFITGEGPHHSFTTAEELGLNVLYGGHYATETFGVKALASHLASAFSLKSIFIDHPTGL